MKHNEKIFLIIMSIIDGYVLLTPHCTFSVGVAGSMDIHCSDNQRISLTTWFPRTKIGLLVFDDGQLPHKSREFFPIINPLFFNRLSRSIRTTRKENTFPMLSSMDRNRANGREGHKFLMIQLPRLT